MAVAMKLLPLCLFGLFVVGFTMVDGAGECGRVPVDRMAFNMAPCVSASQDTQSQVSASCCAQVHKLGQNPSCLCAVMLSNTAKSAGVKPDVAVTIPMRCNLADRPVGLMEMANNGTGCCWSYGHGIADACNGVPL